MTEYRVSLDIYNGPLDLLLYLIRREEVDIHDIPIARITEQYIKYVDIIKDLDINLAGEFLVMAATLMEIKSATLLPREMTEDGEEVEDLSDPRLELVRQLLEYKRFKDIADELGESAQQQTFKFPRSTADLDRVREHEKQQREIDMDALEIWDLFDAFNRLMAATLITQRHHEVVHDDTPIDVFEVQILGMAQQEKTLTFEKIFRGRKHRSEMVALFLALLELMRQKLVRIEQEDSFTPIYIFPLTEEPAELAVTHAISAEAEHLPSEIIKDHTRRQTEAKAPAQPAKEPEPTFNFDEAEDEDEKDDDYEGDFGDDFPGNP